FLESALPIQSTQTLPAFPTEAAVFATPQSPPIPASTAAAADPAAACAPLYFPADGERPQYRLDMYAGLETHAVDVHETISYPNTSTDTLESIRLVVEPKWTPGVFNLAALEVSGETPEGASLSGGYLDIPLPVPLPPDCTLVLDLKFVLVLPYQEGIFGYTDNQTMLTNWYPFVPPYHPDLGWQTNRPGEYGEHLVYPMADFRVRLEFQEKDRTIPVAAPAPGEVEDGITTYRLTGARTFSLAFLPRHNHLSQMVDNISLHIYYRGSSKAAAQAALETMAKSIVTFEALFGTYPFESLTTAEIEMVDGMEYDGVFFIGSEVFDWYNRSQKNTFSLMLAHETSHNWWFSQVANDQAMEPWLDEALATYCELLYLEDHYPDLVDWWWAFRVDYYDPYGPVDATIYEYDYYEPYRQAVYLRGVQFLQAVRDQVGDEAFFEFLRQYYQGGRSQVVTAELFFETLDGSTIIEFESIRSSFFNH
ncbi:MAG TPA: M1 family metallopeptidase, partial [Anaerolineales bacterium]|nr:M1 family metallopeptidase [Anaerolineales bacterium]